MNVASLENCQTLYDMSGWIEDPSDNFDEGLTDGAFVPIYTLGYLLRKLPEVTVVFMQRGGKSWRCHHTPQGSIATLGCEAYTPEDAACKLAIELFKQGILSKEI